ncbi:MAG: tRNA (adenosine(37)-N6)-threonylcarbamoyltransferase complex ATPase subunit type 1 TsaE [Nodosilinea sp. LVE1205-7]|jgi:tRNA threonylcarbamoyladenosine biosynthesis protein TsaE
MELGNQSRDANLPLVNLADSQATLELGESLGKGFPVGTILLLLGDLGSGKTTLVQGLAAGLGIPGPISSPTFTLINEYLEGRLPLYHVDLYRLSPAQVESLDLERYWNEAETPPGIVAIEWGDRLVQPPPQALTLALSYNQPEGRQARLGAIDPANLSQWEAIIDDLLVNEV